MSTHDGFTDEFFVLDRVYTVGGRISANSEATDIVEMQYLDTGRTQPHSCESLHVARYNHAIASIPDGEEALVGPSDYICVAGGRNAEHHVLNSIEIYTCDKDS